MSEGRGRRPPKPAALFVVSAPSGAGKTSLVKELIVRRPQVRMAVSYTTRPRRETEVEGRDYFFVSQERFDAMQRSGGFLEHARVFDHCYATGRDQVQQLLGRGHPVILEIDWQGARQVREAMPECRSVFVLPPSRPELERRLRERGTDSEEVVARRLREAVGDMTHWAEFDYVIVNDDFETAVGELEALVDGGGEGLRAPRRALQPLLRELLA